MSASLQMAAGSLVREWQMVTVAFLLEVATENHQWPAREATFLRKQSRVLVEQHERHGRADDVAPAEHHGPLAFAQPKWST
jgi:hypothetical protein